MYKVILIKKKYNNIFFFGYVNIKKNLYSKKYTLEKEEINGNIIYYLKGEKGDKHKATLYHGDYNSLIDVIWKNYTVIVSNIYKFEYDINRKPTLNRCHLKKII